MIERRRGRVADGRSDLRRTRAGRRRIRYVVSVSTAAHTLRFQTNKIKRKKKKTKAFQPSPKPGKIIRRAAAF